MGDYLQRAGVFNRASRAHGLISLREKEMGSITSRVLRSLLPPFLLLFCVCVCVFMRAHTRTHTLAQFYKAIVVAVDFQNSPKDKWKTARESRWSQHDFGILCKQCPQTIGLLKFKKLWVVSKFCDSRHLTDGCFLMGQHRVLTSAQTDS